MLEIEVARVIAKVAREARAKTAERDSAQRSKRRISGWLDLSDPQNDTKVNRRLASLVSALGIARTIKVSTSVPTEGFVNFVDGHKVKANPSKKVR